MNTNIRLITALSTLALAACTAQTDGGGQRSESKGEPVQVSEQAQAVETAQRSLDVGKVAPGSEASLQAIIKSGTADERDEAALALSRTYQLQGKTEAAITTLEDLLASHRENDRWEREEEVGNKLAELVTGRAAPVRPEAQERDRISAFARALMPSFHPDAKGAYELDVMLVGGSGTASNRLGTFNVGDAIHDRALEQCPLCEKRPKVHTHQSRIGTWLSVPKYRERFDTALTVFFYDKTANRIPARYEQYLPMSVKEIDERLASGQGLIAVKQRESAPPVILIAAPRFGQITDVETALSEMSKLPEGPVSVKLAGGLRRDEIQSVIRGARKEFKACYEALLTRAASAAGKVTLEFSIDAEGTVRSPLAKADGDALSEPQFLSCFSQATQALTFPAAGVSTTVKYPLELSP